MTEFRPEELDDWIVEILGPHSVAAIHETSDRTLFDTYVNEALFFWRFLKPLLEQHEPARALEVGAGVGLLSLFAVTEIESVTSLEPESSGFGKMSTFRKIIVDAWPGQTAPEFKGFFLNELSEEQTFDFIYSINVLEHVPNPEALIQEIHGRLRPGGMAWFVLPNYAFPYEQHFEIPILLNKSMTEKLFRNKIENHKGSPDSKGLWAELSWPTQKQLSKTLKSSGWSHQFHKTVLEGYFDRLSEPVFVLRKGNLYKALRPLIKLLKPVIIGLPLGVLPIIEFTIHKPAISQPNPCGVEK
jgi:2-polyprenyl-3-methyl-5-hydroxy-6-metoxy-1,4-benzoquinol methylase